MVAMLIQTMGAKSNYCLTKCSVKNKLDQLLVDKMVYQFNVIPEQMVENQQLMVAGAVYKT